MNHSYWREKNHCLGSMWMNPVGNPVVNLIWESYVDIILYKVLPQFGIAKLVQITPIPMVYR